MGAEYVTTIPENSQADIVSRVLSGNNISNWIRLAQAGLAVSECEAKVLRYGSEFDAYIFAKNVPGADVAACQKRVLEGKSGQVLGFFAQGIDGADIEALQLRILEVGNGLDSVHFGLTVPKADIQALYLHAKMVGVIGGDLRQDLEARAMSPKAQCHAQTKAFDLQQSRVLSHGDLDSVIWLASHFKRADVAACQDRILSSRNAWSLYRYAKEVVGADVQALHKRFMEINRGGFIAERFNDLLATCGQQRQQAGVQDEDGDSDANGALHSPAG